MAVSTALDAVARPLLHGAQMMRPFFVTTGLAFLLTGCPGTTFDVVETRARREGERVVVDVDVRASDDIERHCVRVTFWEKDDLRETWIRCGGELDGGKVVTYPFRTELSGSRCTTFTVETSLALDEDGDIEIPTPRANKAPTTAAEGLQRGFERPCPTP